MLFKFTSYIKFLIKSTNQHGVHSPFVYNLITKCLYNKSLVSNSTELDILIKENKLPKKEKNLAEKIINYLKDKNESFKVTGLKNLEGSDTFDLIFLDNPKEFKLEKIIPFIHNDSVILTHNIYDSKENYKKWLSLIQKNEIKVSVDMYSLGLIFFRKEQVKEHFIIRV